jgi:hypothetical protein
MVPVRDLERVMSVDVGDRNPVNFEQWPRSGKIEYLQLSSTRAGLIMRALGAAGRVPDREIGSRTRLRKEELALLVLALEGEIPAGGQ